MPAADKNVPFAPHRKPDPRIADPGKVRLGDSMVEGTFPPRREVDPRPS
jgi:hypothetical protein